MFKLNDICYGYGQNVGLSHINLGINKGEMIGIMGPNGSGKSTLFKIMTGLIKPDSGDFLFLGNLAKFDVLRQNIGFVFQNSSLQLFMETVEEELSFGPEQAGLLNEEIKRRVSDVLQMLEIEHLKDKVPYQLSGGEQKLVAIGSVLVTNPQVLILDEPFAGLSLKYQKRIINVLLKLGKMGKTVIISSHNFNMIHSIIERIVILNDSHKIEYDGLVSNLPKMQLDNLQLL